MNRVRKHTLLATLMEDSHTTNPSSGAQCGNPLSCMIACARGEQAFVERRS